MTTDDSKLVAVLAARGDVKVTCHTPQQKNCNIDMIILCSVFIFSYNGNLKLYLCGNYSADIVGVTVLEWDISLKLLKTFLLIEIKLK